MGFCTLCMVTAGYGFSWHSKDRFFSGTWPSHVLSQGRSPSKASFSNLCCSEAKRSPSRYLQPPETRSPEGGLSAQQRRHALLPGATRTARFGPEHRSEQSTTQELRPEMAKGPTGAALLSEDLCWPVLGQTTNAAAAPEQRHGAPDAHTTQN